MSDSLFKPNKVYLSTRVNDVVFSAPHGISVNRGERPFLAHETHAAETHTTAIAR